MLDGIAEAMVQMASHNHTLASEVGSAALAMSGAQTVNKGKLILAIFETLQTHPLGYVGFLVLLTIWTSLALPVTPMEVCGGCAFGVYWGTAGSLFGKTMGCMLALCVGRFLGQSQGWKMPSALEQYLGLLKTRPFQTMCAIRIAPIPLGVKNYGLSLVRFPNDRYPYDKYFWSCLVVGLPFSLAWGVIGAGIATLKEAVEKYG